MLREDFLESLNPDVIHIGSLFEGYLDDAIMSIGKLDSSASVSITLHDLIPLVNPEQFLSDNPGYSSFYNSKLKLIGQAKLLLTNSKSTKQEALDNLKIQNDRVINISTGINHDLFKEEDTGISKKILCRLGIKKHYFFTAGANKYLKIISKLSSQLQQSHQG